MNIEPQEKQYNPADEVIALANSLRVGKRYTFRRINPDIGGLEEIRAAIVSVELCSYAQYQNAVKVRFFRHRSRTSETMFFYANEKYSTLPVVWYGYVYPAEVIDSDSIKVESNTLTYRYKYFSTDSRYVSDAIEQQPEGIVFRPVKY